MTIKRQTRNGIINRKKRKEEKKYILLWIHFQRGKKWVIFIHVVRACTTWSLIPLLTENCSDKKILRKGNDKVWGL